eukprot:8720034-Ditylum_brightwellii.AAC.1
MERINDSCMTSFGTARVYGLALSLPVSPCVVGLSLSVPSSLFSPLRVSVRDSLNLDTRTTT